MEKQKKYKYELCNLNCAGCAGKIESDLISAEFIDLAALNFASKQLIIRPKTAMTEEDVRVKVDQIVKKYEKDVDVLSRSDEEKMSGKSGNGSLARRKEILEKALLALGSILFGIGLLSRYQLNFGFYIETGFFIGAYLLIGAEVLISAVRNILRGSWFDEQFLMTIATLSAWGIGEYPEAVAVMLFYKVGELFEDYAVNKSRKTIEGLVDIKENTTHLVDDFHQIKDVPTDFVKVGSMILVRPGERIPLDGVIVEGNSILDVSALTGESLPIKAGGNDTVFSGAINLNSVLKIRTTADFENSMVGKILDLIENAGGRKAATEKFITRFAKYYTPTVVFTALALALIPPFFTGHNFGEWIYRASIFLVVSCPCALVISVPLGYFGGIGKASKYGILVKGGNYLEALTKVDTVLLDKTGTITQGKFSVSSVQLGKGATEADLLQTVLDLEHLSNHPIAKSIVKYAEDKNYRPQRVSNYEEIPGKGIKANSDGASILGGNEKILRDLGIEIPVITDSGSVVYVVKDNQLLGTLVVSDMIKATSKEAIQKLKAAGIKQVVMLTGGQSICRRRGGASGWGRQSLFRTFTS